MRGLLAATLLHERWRSLLGVGALGAALALMLVFEGFRVGLYEQARALPASWGVDLVAVQAGVENVVAARSILPQQSRRAVERVTGVIAAHPVGGLPAIYASHGVSTPVYVIVYDTAGGPRELVAGRPIREAGEIVVDRTLAARYGLGPGDPVEFLGYRFRLAGIAAGPTNAFNPYVYVRLVDLVDLSLEGAFSEELDMETAVSFLLIDVAPGASPPAVRAAIEAEVVDVDVYTPAEIGENDVRVMEDMMGPAMTLLVMVARVAGVLVAGLAIYAFVVARERDFAIVRALGARRAAVGRYVGLESAMVAGAGYLVALAVAGAVAVAVDAVAPRYAVAPFDAMVLARTGIAGGAMVALAAAVGVRRALTVDPMLVFKR